MKVTRLGRPRPVLSATSLGGSGGSFDGGGNPGGGLVPTASGSNTWAWGSNVASIRADGTLVLGPHVAFAEGSGITLSVSSNTVTIASGASSGLGWFNVEDYGAVHDGSTDDTVAIQDAIDAAEAAGGGVVYFPKGVYSIEGALQDTSRSNSQLVLPQKDYVDDEQLTIVLLGEVPPPTTFSVIGATPLPDTHAILMGTLVVAAGTSPSLLGGWGPDSDLDFTNINLRIENLAFRLPENPVYSALNLSKVAGVDLDNVLCDVSDYQIQGITEPTTAASYGIRLPELNNGALTRLGVVNVAGYYNGIQIGEHTLGQDVTAWGCKVGFQTIAGYHASHFSRLMAVHCERVLQGTGGAHYLSISQLNIEHAASGWWVTDEDIDDPSNYLNGWAHWKVTLAGTGHDSTFTIDGATNFHTLEMGDDPFGAGATALDDLSDVVIAGVAADDTLRYVGGGWTNDNRRWEAVTNGEDVFVWESDDLVHEWKDY
jgi:hypothetical protein